MSTDNKSSDRHTEQERDPGLSRLYQESSQETPPDRLDRDILHYARNNLRKRHRLPVSPFTSNWTIPVSLAAVLLISIALVPIIRQEMQSPRQKFKDEHGIAATRTEEQRRIPEVAEGKKENAAPLQDSSATDTRLTDLGKSPARAKSTAPMSREPLMPEPSPALTGAPPSPASIQEKSTAAEASGTTSAGVQSDSTARLANSGFNRDDPESWLIHIQKLLRENKTAEAKSSYQSFIQRYPQYPGERVLGEKLELLTGSQ